MGNEASRDVETAVIGGTGLESLLTGVERIRIGTPYGIPPPISVGQVHGKSVAFIPRHGHEHSVPPHKIGYRANVYALHMMGVERIIATNAVGAINLDFKPCDLVVPHDLIDFTKRRALSFFDASPVTHVDFSEPYCPEIRRALIEQAEKTADTVRHQAVYVCTEGPRFETPAEIRMFRSLGCDVVGMTGVPEAVLARELGMCYGALCFVSNMAAGIEKRLTSREVVENSRLVSSKIHKILIEVIRYLPKTRSCSCASSTEESRIGETDEC